MKVYKSRARMALNYVHGDVLDIGCVGMGKNDVVGGEDFIHGEIKKRAKTLTGLDINAVGAKRMNEMGFNIIVKDAQEPYDLGRTFDTIVSEENIEHIANLKTYLENIHKHLKDDGTLIVTTPNINCLDYMIHMFIWGKMRVNQYHTHYHTVDTIKYLLESYGFEIVKLDIFQAINWRIQNFGGKIAYFLVRPFPKRFGRNMLIIAKKKSKKVD